MFGMDPKLYTKEREMRRTAEMMCDIVSSRGEMGIYYAVALLHDSQRTTADVMPYLLEETKRRNGGNALPKENSNATTS